MTHENPILRAFYEHLDAFDDQTSTDLVKGLSPAAHLAIGFLLGAGLPQSAAACAWAIGTIIPANDLAWRRA